MSASIFEADGHPLCLPELCAHEVDDLEVGGDVSWRGEAVVAAGELGRDRVGGHGTHDLAAA